MDKILKCDYSVAVPDLQIRGRWGEGPGHPEPEIREVGASLNKNRGNWPPRAPPLDPPLLLKRKILSCTVLRFFTIYYAI